MQKNTVLLVLVLSMLTHFSFSQKNDSTKGIRHYGTVVSVTTKGISTIPSFTLGKPAVIFDVAMGTRKLSFEPQFRFSLEGKPWSFLFWWRYKLLTTDKFKLISVPILRLISEPWLSSQMAFHEKL
jgi:hypothetical protein